MDIQVRKKSVSALALATLLIGAPSLANDSNWYATASVGVGFLSSTAMTYDDGSDSGSFDADFEASFAGGGTVGYRFSDRFSLEGEIMYRRNDLEVVNVPGLGAFSGGDFASLGIGVNALYRFPVGNSGKLSGYLGPGYVFLEEIDIDFDSNGQQEISFETDDGGLQFKFGGRYQASDRWFIDAGATYFTVDSVLMTQPETPTSSIQSDYDHWTLSLAAGFTF